MTFPVFDKQQDKNEEIETPNREESIQQDCNKDISNNETSNKVESSSVLEHIYEKRQTVTPPMLDP